MDMKRLLCVLLVACSSPAAPPIAPQPRREQPSLDVAASRKTEWASSADAPLAAPADAGEATWADNTSGSPPDASATIAPDAAPVVEPEVEIDYENGIAIRRLKAPPFCVNDGKLTLCMVSKASCESVRRGAKVANRCVEHRAMVCVVARKIVTGDERAFCTPDVTSCVRLVESLAGPDFLVGECLIWRYRKQ